MAKGSKIRFFPQHTPETCGISCILMIAKYFKKIEYTSIGQEKNLYELYRCKKYMGTLASAAAACLSYKYHLDVAVYHSSSEYLENKENYFDTKTFGEIYEEYKNTIKGIQNSVLVEKNFDFTPKWYRERLDEGKLLMVESVIGTAADEKLDKPIHWILIYGYEDSSFLICDPARPNVRGKRKLTEEELVRITDTPIGSICVTAQKKSQI